MSNRRTSCSLISMTMRRAANPVGRLRYRAQHRRHQRAHGDEHDRRHRRLLRSRTAHGRRHRWTRGPIRPRRDCLPPLTGSTPSRIPTQRSSSADTSTPRLRRCRIRALNWHVWTRFSRKHSLKTCPTIRLVLGFRARTRAGSARWRTGGRNDGCPPPVNAIQPVTRSWNCNTAGRRLRPWEQPSAAADCCRGPRPDSRPRRRRRTGLASLDAITRLKEDGVERETRELPDRRDRSATLDDHATSACDLLREGN